MIDQQDADGTWHYGLLYDFIAATTSVTEAEMQSLASHMEGLQPATRGAVAVVATNPTFFPMSRMYSLLTVMSGLRFQLFRDRQSAEYWLELQRVIDGSDSNR